MIRNAEQLMSSHIILITIAAYFGLLLLIARIAGRKNSGNDAFFLGNRDSPWHIVAIGMVGASLSGVTFVSVPGLVRQFDMTYMQMVFGFFFGYLAVAKILLPLYYRLNVISIYSYLHERIGWYGYKTGASFFLLSKLIGAASRLYLVLWILQLYVFDQWRIPFVLTAICGVLLVWLYTYRSGIKTIIWTDILQTLCLVAMLIAILWVVKDRLDMDISGMIQTISENPHFRIFEWKDWGSTQHFAKQFLSGIFITIVMTGLDQDMMQKNLSCRNLKDAQKNMYWYGLAFTPINFLFLCLGILLLVAASQLQIELPASGDDILPMFCTSGLLDHSILVFFTIGIIAAAFSSADSALTALTTSFCVDILGIEGSECKVGMERKREDAKARKTRMTVHIVISIIFVLVILIFKAINNRSLIDAIYTIASYTYGPLLGLFAFGLFTKRQTKDRYVPFICVASPLICYLTNQIVYRHTGYLFGYELLLLNGLITFAGLWIWSGNMNQTVRIKNTKDGNYKS
jgi:Na+/proline symporter